MNSRSYRSGQFAAADADPFVDHVVLTSHHPGQPSGKREASTSPASWRQRDTSSGSSGRYSDQPMSWSTRLFGLGGTGTIVGLVLACALLTWKVVYQPVRPTSRPLTVIELQPRATPPEPVHDIAPGPEQVEKQEIAHKPTVEPIPVPVIQIPMASTSVRESREPTANADPGPPAPDTTAPKSVVAPAATRLSDNARPDWEGLILAHLERFRRYPSRARAARQQGTVYVRFTMNRAGMVLSSAIVRKSGSFDLDQAALDTLARAQPLPAIPADKPDTVELTIPVEFLLR